MFSFSDIAQRFIFDHRTQVLLLEAYTDVNFGLNEWISLYFLNFENVSVLTHRQLRARVWCLNGKIGCG